MPKFCLIIPHHAQATEVCKPDVAARLRVKSLVMGLVTDGQVQRQREKIKKSTSPNLPELFLLARRQVSSGEELSGPQTLSIARTATSAFMSRATQAAHE